MDVHFEHEVWEPTNRRTKKIEKTLRDTESVMKIVVMLFPSHATYVFLYSQHFSLLLLVGS